MAEGEVVAGAHVSGAMQRDAAALARTGRCSGNTEAIDIDVAGGRVRAVMTSNPDHPRLDCDYVVIATNIWAPLLGDRLGVPIPLMGYEHQYLVSGPLPELDRFDPANPDDEIVYPSVRELDTYLYFRQHWNAVRDRELSPRPPTGVGRTRWEQRDPPVHPQRLRRRAVGQGPPACFRSSATTDFRTYPKQMNGIFAFPVDGMPVVGPTLIEGAWVAAGSWLTHAGGVGKTVAEWMTDGDTEWDVRQMDVNRFHAFQTTPRFIEKVCNKNYAEIYDIIHPREPISEPRNVRLSPDAPTSRGDGRGVHHLRRPRATQLVRSRTPAAVAQYADSIPERTGWAAMHWSPLQGVEHLATRERVGLFDLTGLSIIEVAGPDALALVDIALLEPGRCPVREGCLHDLADRAAAGCAATWRWHGSALDRFWMFVGEGTRPRDFDWVRRAAAGHGVAVIDLSDSYTAIGLWGPQARNVLSKVSTADLSNEAFPYFSARWIDVGYTRALAIRISYAGELGWELHFPNEFGLPVWDLLLEAGQDRWDHSRRAWGPSTPSDSRRDTGAGAPTSTPSTTPTRPVWDGRSSSTRGRSGVGGGEAAEPAEPANEEARAASPSTTATPWPWATNRSWHGDLCVGHVTSANFGYSVGKFIVYGYLPAEFAIEGTEPRDHLFR